MEIHAIPRNGFRLLMLTISRFSSDLSLLSRGAVRVFIFAGQSNMVGSDSKVKDIDQFLLFETPATPTNV